MRMPIADTEPALESIARWSMLPGWPEPTRERLNGILDGDRLSGAGAEPDTQKAGANTTHCVMSGMGELGVQCASGTI